MNKQIFDLVAWLDRLLEMGEMVGVSVKTREDAIAIWDDMNRLPDSEWLELRIIMLFAWEVRYQLAHGVPVKTVYEHFQRETYNCNGQDLHPLMHAAFCWMLMYTDVPQSVLAYSSKKEIHV